MREFYQLHYGDEEDLQYAKYRISDKGIELQTSLAYGNPSQRRIVVPERLEVLCTDNTWKIHPVIFDFQDLCSFQTKVIFLQSGACYLLREQYGHNDELLLENARRISPDIFKGTREDILRVNLKCRESLGSI